MIRCDDADLREIHSVHQTAERVVRNKIYIGIQNYNYCLPNFSEQYLMINIRVTETEMKNLKTETHAEKSDDR